MCTSWNKWERRVVTLAPQGGFLHSGIGFSRSQMSSLFLGRVSISFSLGVTAYITTFIWQPSGFQITVQLLTQTRALCAELLLCYGGCYFHRGGPLQGILGPCSLEGRMGGADLFLTFSLLLSQNQMDGPQDAADWEASWMRADVAYTLVI